MNIRNLFLIFFLCCAGSLRAQEQTVRFNTDRKFDYWAVKLPLANLFDLYSSPNVQLGIERRFDKHNGAQLIGAVCGDPGRQLNLNGYKAKAEYRRYFRVRPMHSFYLAAELEYIQTSIQTTWSYTSSTTGVIYQDEFYLQTKKYGGNIKFGFHKEFRRGMMFDAWAGLGIRHVKSVQKNRDNPADPIYDNPSVDFTIHSSSQYLPYDGTGFSMPINFAWGYIFR